MCGPVRLITAWSTGGLGWRWKHFSEPWPISPPAKINGYAICAKHASSTCARKTTSTLKVHVSYLLYSLCTHFINYVKVCKHSGTAELAQLAVKYPAEYIFSPESVVLNSSVKAIEPWWLKL